jgi:hypothetical protein
MSPQKMSKTNADEQDKNIEVFIDAWNKGTATEKTIKGLGLVKDNLIKILLHLMPSNSSQSTLLDQDETFNMTQNVQHNSPVNINSDNIIQPQDTQKNSVKNDKICQKYRLKQCQFGRSGKGCDFLHPKPCKRFLKFGSQEFNQGGCKFGLKCKSMHPIICKQNLKSNCNNNKCSKLHIFKATIKNIPTAQHTWQSGHATPLPRYSNVGDNPSVKVTEKNQTSQQSSPFLDIRALENRLKMLEGMMNMFNMVQPPPSSHQSPWLTMSQR